jgi:hypothetical protein
MTNPQEKKSMKNFIKFVRKNDSDKHPKIIAIVDRTEESWNSAMEWVEEVINWEEVSKQSESDIKVLDYDYPERIGKVTPVDVNYKVNGKVIATISISEFKFRYEDGIVLFKDLYGRNPKSDLPHWADYDIVE